MRIAEGLPDDILRDVDRLKVNRRGEAVDAFMVTHEIVGHVAPGRVYCIGEHGIVDAPLNSSANSSANSPAEAPPMVDAAAQGSTFPPHLRLSGEWDSSVAVETEQANIFGDIGTLTLDSADIVIPAAAAISEMLGFYDARLLIAGEPFAFDTPVDLPIIHMEVGASYTTGFLEVASKGGGPFLEHHDRPHLHIPLDEEAGGYLILGRRASSNDGADYLVSGFRIPFGSALYTPSDVLHADPYLTGNYLVVYGLTENFSNAVLRAPGGGMVSVRFAPLE